MKYRKNNILVEEIKSFEGKGVRVYYPSELDGKDHLRGYSPGKTIIDDEIGELGEKMVFDNVVIM